MSDTALLSTVALGAAVTGLALAAAHPSVRAALCNILEKFTHQDRESAATLVFEGDLLECVLAFLSAEELVATIPTSRSWAQGATADTVWAARCADLWEGKVCVPHQLRDTSACSRIAAFWRSIADSKRTSLTTDELCSMQ